MPDEKGRIVKGEKKSQSVKEKISKSLKGNKSGVKLKDPDVRQEAYRQYCEWIASGYPKEAFFFDHPTQYACSDTIERYIEENPSEFPPHLLRAAMSKRYKYWFDKGKNLVDGRMEDIPRENRGSPSPQVWQTIMRNMFKNIGWDADQAPRTHEAEVRKFLKYIES